MVGDRFRCRGFITILATSTALVGFSLFYGSDNSNVKYGSLFLQISGVYTFAPATSTWVPNNSAPHIAKATAVATGFVATNCGGILSSWIATSEEGYITAIVFCCVGIVLTLLNIAHLLRQNRLKAEERARLEKHEPKLNDVEVTSVSSGDKSPYFVYTL